MMATLPRRAHRCAALASLLLLPALTGVLAVRSAAQETTTYTLTRTYKSGDVDHYKIVFHTVVNGPQTGGMPVDVMLNMLMRETTKEVKTDGSGILEDKFEEANAKFGDNEMDAASFLPVVTQTRSKAGQVLDTKSEGGNGPFASGGTQILMIFAQQGGLYAPAPVKAGDTWKVELANPENKETKTTGTGTLVGKDKVGTTDVLKIKLVTDTKASVTTPENGKQDVKLHFEGVGSMDPATGRVLRMTATIDSDAGANGKQKADVTLSLVPPGSEKKTDASTGNGQAKPSGQR